MADWNYGAGDAEAVKLYSRKLFRQAIPMTAASKLCLNALNPKDPNNVIQFLDDTQKTSGDTIKYDVVNTINIPGVQGDNIIDGNEAALVTYQDTLVIDQLRFPVLIRGAMSQQRVPFSMRNAAQDVLALAWRERTDVGLLNQLAGNSLQTDVRYTGMQAATLPTSANWFVAGQVNGTAGEAALTSSNNMDLTLINKLKSFCQVCTYPIRPIAFKGGVESYIMIMHPFQAQKLKNSTASGSWGDIQLAALKGGEITGNPLFTGALGLYENTLLFSDQHVPYGNSVSNTRPGQALFPSDAQGSTIYTYNAARAVFLGAQAGVVGFGRAMDWPMRI